MTEYGLIPIPNTGPEREAMLRQVIAYGGSEEMLRKFFDCDQVERDLANQQAQTVEVANRLADIGTHLMDMTEALTVRADKQRRLDAKRKADQERQAAEAEARAEQEEILEYLETHPEPGAPKPDDGELETHPAPDKERYGAPEVEEDAGGIPMSYGPNPESYIRGGDELEEPGIGGASHLEPDPEDLGGPQDPKQVPQPVSASFW
jgi:hypothetical protein